MATWSLIIEQHTEYGIKGIVGQPAKLPNSQSKEQGKLKVVELPPCLRY